ncbi:hypothetical protein PVAP13_3KG481601 [Panicum virgatum]|uniref:Uncharacterized protein n=1 Tax=Panicum virgatum TaxID=38727 RepID=A0A8T0VET2_PANVG|nr:hypothetical protein PVAP13_3KG481601 [Panicum virgatum]
MRFAGLSPIKQTIGHSKVFAKPPPSTALCPATPCDGVRPRRLTTKTGPPALPLRHRCDRGYKDRHGAIWSVVDAVVAGARAFSEVRAGARAPPHRRRASPPAEIGTASLFPFFSAYKVTAGPGTAWAHRSSPAVAAVTMSALGIWRSEASWVAGNSLRCWGTIAC